MAFFEMEVIRQVFDGVAGNGPYAFPRDPSPKNCSSQICNHGLLAVLRQTVILTLPSG